VSFLIAAALLIGGLLGALGFIWCVKSPARTIVPLYAALLPIAGAVDVSVPLPDPFNSLSSVLGALAIAAGLLHATVYRRARVPSVAIGCWLLFLTWICVTAFWALDKGAALRTIAIALPLVLLMAVIGMLRTDETDFEVLRIAVMLSGIIVGLYAVGLQVSGAPLPTHGFGQRFSISTDPEQTNPNILAASLLFPLALATERTIFGGARWLGSRGWRIVGAGGVLLTGAAIFLTASRGGILSAGGVILATLLFSTKVPGGGKQVLRTLALALALAISVTTLILLVSPFTPPALTNRIKARLVLAPLDRIQRVQTDDSGRFDIWRVGYLACRTHCFLGVGPGNFGTIYNDLFPFAGIENNTGPRRVAHNVYLSLAVETGLVGLTILGIALVVEWVFLSSLPAETSIPSLKAGVVGLLMANVFLGAIWFKYFWLVFSVNRAAESVLPRQEIPSEETGMSHLHWSAYADTRGRTADGETVNQVHAKP